MKKILLVDNFDSFTYNLMDYLCQLGCSVTVWQNQNKQLLEKAQWQNFDGILLSPGPGKPDDAGFLLPFCQLVRTQKPVLGVCLGMQALAQTANAAIVNALQPMHGKTSIISHNKSSLFENLPTNFSVMRYHSLVVYEPDCELNNIEITAKSNDTEEVMAISLDNGYTQAVQFHPESILTENGLKILKNWLNKI